MRVLVVEDEVRLANNIAEALRERCGFAVDCAENGADGAALTEYRLFEYLIFRPRAIVSARELLEHLYDYNWQHHSNVIEAHISNLRKKLRAVGEETSIATLRGRGYRLEAPEKQQIGR